jgi:hypothetical protein
MTTAGDAAEPGGADPGVRSRTAGWSRAAPDRTHPWPAGTGVDSARQAVVVSSGVAAVLGLAVGVGAFGGTPIADAAGGALSADATLVAPAGPAFAIWTPIYLGLVAYALWQLLPSRRADPRQRRVGWAVAVTMLANTAWILVVQAGALRWSVAVIAGLLVALIVTYVLLLTGRPSGPVEAVVLDGTIGLYLGWVSVATIANVAAMLVAEGHSDLGLIEEAWAFMMLAAAGAIGVAVAAGTGGRFAYGAALTWGLAWIAVGRSDGSGEELRVAAVAAGAAAVVALATVLARVRHEVVRRRRRAQSRAAGPR